MLASRVPRTITVTIEEGYRMRVGWTMNDIMLMTSSGKISAK